MFVNKENTATIPRQKICVRLAQRIAALANVDHLLDAQISASRINENNRKRREWSNKHFVFKEISCKYKTFTTALPFL
jgi:hypothetical protein